MGPKKANGDFEHAEHNYEAYQALLQNGNFSDWVVTTAFYSAIYYANFQLFPNQFDLGGKLIKCSNFIEYYTKRISKPKDNKHSVLEDLVHDSLNEIYVDFSTLKELCFTARYKRYKITNGEIELTKESINNIRRFCQPDPDITVAQKA